MMVKTTWRLTHSVTHSRRGTRLDRAVVVSRAGHSGLEDRLQINRATDRGLSSPS